MRNIDEDTITQAVIARHAAASDARLREVMTSLVQHLHAFAREVKLTEAEWIAGHRFLTEAGHITDDKRQEFILLSDTLGLSMLVSALNHEKPAGCTEATVFGPVPRGRCAALSSWAPTSPTARRASRVSSTRQVRGLDGTPVRRRRGRRCGRPMPKASTTCSARATTRTARAACCTPTPQGRLSLPLDPGRALPDPARRPGGPHARATSAATRGARRTCTS